MELSECITAVRKIPEFFSIKVSRFTYELFGLVHFGVVPTTPNTPLRVFPPVLEALLECFLWNSAQIRRRISLCVLSYCDQQF
jgi:hypothetical protein